jgi:hypothetical protein
MRASREIAAGFDVCVLSSEKKANDNVQPNKTQ